MESVSKSKTPPPKSKSTGWAMNNQPLAKGSVAPSLGRYLHRFLLFPCSFSDTCPVCTTCQNAGTRAEERAKALKPKTKSADEVKAVTLTTHSILSGSPSKDFARWFSSTTFGWVQKKHMHTSKVGTHLEQRYSKKTLIYNTHCCIRRPILLATNLLGGPRRPRPTHSQPSGTRRPRR